MFRQERAALLRYIRRSVGADMADDIAQEVFARAAASAQLACLLNPRAFLYHIARTVVIDNARRTRCRMVTLPLIEALDAPCAAEQEQRLDAEDLMSSLEQALSGLPVKTRTIFRMHRFDEKAYQDIRIELGMSLPAVEYHMMKALAHIRKELADRL